MARYIVEIDIQSPECMEAALHDAAVAIRCKESGIKQETEFKFLDGSRVRVSDRPTEWHVCNPPEPPEDIFVPADDLVRLHEATLHAKDILGQYVLVFGTDVRSYQLHRQRGGHRNIVPQIGLRIFGDVSFWEDDETTRGYLLGEKREEA